MHVQVVARRPYASGEGQCIRMVSDFGAANMASRLYSQRASLTKDYVVSSCPATSMHIGFSCPFGRGSLVLLPHNGQASKLVLNRTTMLFGVHLFTSLIGLTALCLESCRQLRCEVHQGHGASAVGASCRILGMSSAGDVN